MNDLMIFEGNEVEVFEFKGEVLFNPKHVAKCLDISDVNSSIRNFNDKQVVKLTNSDVHDMHNPAANHSDSVDTAHCNFRHFGVLYLYYARKKIGTCKFE